MLDDLERALEAADKHEEATLEEGVRLVAPRRCARRSSREGLVEIETDGAFDPHVHEALLSQPPEARGGRRHRGAPEGLPARRPRAAPRPGGRRRSEERRVETSPYEVLGVAKTASARRGQEGLPQARPRVPPGPQPRRQRRRGALQGSAVGLRRPLRSGEAPQYDTFGAAAVARRPGRSGGGFGGMRFEEFDFGDLGDLLGGMFGSGAARAAGRRQPTRGDDLETRVKSRSRTRSRASRCGSRSRVEAACSACHGTGAEPGTSPVDLPRVQRPGRRLRAQGLFALSQPCPRCRGNGTSSSSRASAAAARAASGARSASA